MPEYFNFITQSIEDKETAEALHADLLQSPNIIDVQRLNRTWKNTGGTEFYRVVFAGIAELSDYADATGVELSVLFQGYDINVVYIDGKFPQDAGYYVSGNRTSIDIK
jgi:hypothetical protein